ncbi:putative Ig domain-containing protein [Modicisalibacter xianhensis]|uniref:Putative Ig domain-containing protein n=1 Tax=Modicisalibacter xianhensis TaxID=442341 RepID=A0A4R8G6G2_9GAMM|nr:carbohydrate-binding protein [Halomonas xianhensis]TDX32379.1 putative Ig domain-containing protein [Halomonas xianhensis]
MYSISLVDAQTGALLGGIKEGTWLDTNAYGSAAFRVIPDANAGIDPLSVASLRLTFTDANGTVLAQSDSEAPFLFPAPSAWVHGPASLLVESLDMNGDVLAGASEQIGLTLADGPEVADGAMAPLRYQAEDAQLTGTTITSVGGDDPNASNADEGAYVDYGEPSGESIAFNVEVAEAGTYELSLRYALSQNNDGSERNRPLRLDINDQLVDRMFDLTSTTYTADNTDFSEFGESTILVNLQAGSNTITFTSNGISGPNVDYLEVRQPTQGHVVIQGEDMLLSSAPNYTPEGTDTNRPITTENIALIDDTFRVGAEGASYLDWAYGNADAYAEFTYQAPVAGTYSMTVTYAGSTDRPLDLVSVQGSEATAIGTFGFAATPAPVYLPDDVGDLPTNVQISDEPSSWEGWSTETLSFHLEAGDNLLRLGGRTNGPNIDKVEMMLVDADPVAPSDITLDNASVLENAQGAAIGQLTVEDIDDTTHTFSVDDDRFEVDDSGMLRLKESVSLDFESEQTVTVSVTATDSDELAVTRSFSIAVGDVAESEEPVPEPTGPLAITFTDQDISSYTTTQDNPVGPGYEIVEDGATLSLNDNLWKRVALPQTYLVTENTRIELDLAVGESIPEIVAIGFDLNDNAFDGDRSLYQLAGTQGQGAIIDLRGSGTANDDGTLHFVIDLSEHAGTSLDSLVFISDDDATAELGSAAFSNVQLLEDGDDSTGNQAPRVVGSGIADLELDENALLEIDLPFVDDDGDSLTYSFAITQDGIPLSGFDGLAIQDGVLSGNLTGLEPGTYSVTVTATDPQSASAEAAFLLTVSNVNEAPQADEVALEPYFGAQGAFFDGIELASFASYFTDPDGDSLTLSAEGLPDGLSVDGEGVITGTPTEAGSFEVVIRATDAGGLSDTLTLQFEIDGPDIGDVLSVEAEDFTGLSEVDNFYAAGNPDASGDEIIRLGNTTSTQVTTQLADNGVVPGWYTVSLVAFDETDGAGSLSLQIGETLLQARNTATDTLSDSVVLNDDYGTFLNNASRGTAGQAGNLKQIDFETVIYVDADTLATLTAQGESGELMRIDRLLFTRAEEPINEAPVMAGLDVAIAVDENTSLVAALNLSDAENDPLSVTIEGTDAALFSFDPASGTLAFVSAPDAENPADGDADGVYEITVSVSDGENTISQDVVVSVADINETLSIDQTTYSLAEGLTAVGAIPVVDEDGGATGLVAPAYAITGGADASLFTIDPATGQLAFVAAPDFETAGDADGDNVYVVDVTATDGALEDTKSLQITVTDTDEAAFTPIVLQAEDATLTILDDGANATVTTIRDADNPEVGSGFSGLRPDYSGTGYLDFGDTAGDAVTFEVTVAEAGSYDLNVRYASNTGRPLDLAINGAAIAALPFASTDPDGSGEEEGFDHWAFETITVTLEAGSNSLSLAIPQGATTGPNIDRIEVTTAGSGPIGTDTSADADGNLTLVSDAAALDPAQAATAGFTVTGLDADIQTVEISFDDGATRIPVTPAADGSFTVDMSGFNGTVVATLIVTDAVGNEASATSEVTIGETTAPFLYEIEGEALTIDDIEPTPDTVVRDASNPETNTDAGADGLWDGYSGTGYLDMGGEAGDAAFFDVTVDEAGTYTLTVRYANADGSGADRPMSILVDGTSQGQMAFPNTGAGNAGWQNWTEATIEVQLEAGSNTIRLENVGNAGPNIDKLSVSREGTEQPEEPPFVEPGERFKVKINFQPEGFATPEGYVADTGLAFGEQSVDVGGQTYQYGWVSEASIADGTENGTTPMAINDQTSVAVNDRTDEITGLDPRQGTYAHFDQPAPGYERAGWEIKLEDGYYEVTVSIGDTSGPYDSRNVLNAEGELFNDPFTPFRPDDFPADSNPSDDTDGFRSDLVTRIVQVTDGRLTLDSIGLDNENTEIQYIEIQALPDLTPDDAREAPEDYAFFTDPRAIAGVGENEVEVDLDPADGSAPTGVDPTSDIFLGISVVDGRGGALLESLEDGSIRLFETVTGQEVSFNANTTGGFDSLTISPTGGLKEFTSYTLVIEGFQDRGENDDTSAPTREFQKFTSTFVTGEAPEVVAREVAFNDIVELNGASDGAFGFTSLELSPDGTTMYVATMGGEIKRYDVDPQTGALSNGQTLRLDYFQGDAAGPRGIIGLTVDPNDPNVLWVTDNYPIPLSGRDNGVPDFSGRISKITIDEGDAFTATAETYVTGLPRSNGDHVTNSLEFRPNPDYDAATNPDVPTHLLYLVQGSNSAMGEPDSAWGNRPERLLNATVLEIDPTRDAPQGGFNVATEPLPDDGFNRRYTDDDGSDFKADPIAMGDGKFLVFAENGTATVEDQDGNVIETFYDPFAEDAVVKIFATGVRNAYDLVWHSNGQLYVPTNGSAAGGNVPDNPDTPENELHTNVSKQDDYLFKVEEGGYYGHPNPLRDEYILNGGNPTSGSDPNEVGDYPAGTDPEATYDLEGAYSLGENRSPNGATEYTSGVFGGNLQGNVLFTEYSGGDDIRSITLDANGNIVGDDVLRDVNGNVIRYIDPLDIIENPVTGQLYLLTLNRSNGESQIVRLDPAPGGVITDPEDPVDPEEPSDDLVSLLVIQAEDNTPNDGTSATIADGSGAEIQIRDADNPETTAGLPNGLRPGAYGNDGNTDNTDGVLGGYADFGATNADFLTFSFELSGAQAGDSVLRVRYANGSTADRPLEVFVNNVSVGIFAFAPPTGVTGDDAWSEWLTLDIPADLVSGLNTVRLQATDNTGPNIDQLEILQEPQDTTPGYTEYEAESAELDGAVVVTASEDDRNASGDGFVDFTGSGDQTITWSVDVAEAGTYEIAFRYALATSKADRPLELSINGNAIEVVNFPGQSSEAEDDWYYQTTTVTLQAGSNTVTVTAPDANGPNIDLLRVADTPSDNFEPTYADIDGSGRIELESGDTARAVNERTADFYFTVAADGAYKLDLAANADATDGGQLTLLLNGQPLDEMMFPGVGDAGEESSYVELVAGVSYHLRVVSEADGADDIDYLDISPAPGDPDADIGIQTGDAAYYANRIQFNYLENDSASNPDRDYKESGTVVISNTGSSELSVIDVDIDGPFELAVPDIFDGLTLAAGESIEVTVLFDREAYTPPATDGGDGVFEGVLRLVTNDADTPVAEVHLAGFWQARDEGGWEPNVNEVWEVFGFGNRIAGLTTVGGGENSVLNDYDLYRPVNDDEVLSRYWTIAEGYESAKITQLAAFHGNGGATLGIHNPQNKGQDITLSNHAGDNNQSILPITSSGQFATATFTRDQIPDSWIGNDMFGIEVAGLSTDPSLNPTGGGDVPDDAEGIERGYTVRMFQALDADGNVIPNTYLGIMDYTGINYDYNDNMFVIEGIAPASGGEISITNLDGVPSDDRLVMSRIENPANSSQEVHDEVTFTITNDGFANLEISQLEIADPSLFEIVGNTTDLVVAPGSSLDVTVRFIGQDSNDGTLYESSLIIHSNDGDEGQKVIQLAGIAQGQSENGQEPTVQEIVNAFGFSTDVAQGEMNQGGLVEANGDEILSPYFQRADGASPIKITQLAAYHTQGDIARLFIHDVDSRDIDEILAHDEQDGQTLLPRTLNGGDALTTTTLDRDAPFGFFAEISGRQGYISWSDPDANLYEDTIDEIGTPGTNLNWDENDGHLIRVYVAKDADGNVIPNTYIVIQDYAGVNYDYNDNIFLVENVQTYDPSGAEDADGNGRVDIYDDADGDGVPNFLDGDVPEEPDTQSAYNDSGTPWVVDGDGLTLKAADYDQGGQGIAYNDSSETQLGSGYRGEGVDIVGNGTAIGWIENGEWVEYTINVTQAGTYELSFLSALGAQGGSARSITASFAQGETTYATATPVAVDYTGNWTSFQQTDSVQVELEAGVQVVRLTFNGGSQDLASFSLAPVATNAAPVVDGGLDDLTATEDQAFSFTIPSDAFDDADGDALTYTASGLPAGLSMSSAGVISGVPSVAGNFDILVTASDGEASVESGFTLTVAGVPDGDDGQTPFNESGTPWAVGDGITLQAAAFDVGGEGVSYSDTEAEQMGSSYREGGVDIVGNGSAIGWVDDSEWVEYTIEVEQAGVYYLSFVASTPTNGVTITAALEQDGSFYTTSSPLAVPNTGAWSNPGPTEALALELQAGVQTLRLTFNGETAQDLMDIQSLTLVREEQVDDGQTPFNETQTPWLVDADGLSLNAAWFDDGDAGDAYSDSDSIQSGVTFRDGSVDIVDDGEAIGWIANGEWVEYTVDVEQAGTYNLSFVTATPHNGRSITASMEQDGTFYAQSAPLAVPNSGAWGNYVSTGTLALDLQAGEQVLRLTFNGGSMDLQSLLLEPQSSSTLQTATLVGFDTLLAEEDNAVDSSDDDTLPMSEDVVVAGTTQDDQGDSLL